MYFLPVEIKYFNGEVDMVYLSKEGLNSFTDLMWRLFNATLNIDWDKVDTYDFDAELAGFTAEF